MILIINTADSEKIFIGLAKDGKLVVQKEFKAKYRQAEKLLPEIDRLTKKQASKLDGIVVVSGQGPFTALRIGVIIANTLGWALRIPVVGIKLDEFNNVDDLIKKGLSKLEKIKPGNIIEPFYGKEPNITKKKS